MNVPFIIDKGGAWFNGLGMGRSGGTRVVCVSGHVAKPGVFELPMGITFKQIIDDVCGGVRNGRTVKAVIPGGVSMPPLDIDELDVPCEFDALQTDERIKPVMVRRASRSTSAAASSCARWRAPAASSSWTTGPTSRARCGAS